MTPYQSPDRLPKKSSENQNIFIFLLGRGRQDSLIKCPQTGRQKSDKLVFTHGEYGR